MQTTMYNHTMAKRKQPTPAANSDRHDSKFMVRLPEIYRELLKAWQDKHKQETRIRPSMTTGIKIALEDFFKKHGIGNDADLS